MPMRNFFELYDALIDGISSDAVVADTLMGECWTAVEAGAHFGMAMTTPVDTAPRMLSGDYAGRSLKELAQTAKSWNLTEAGFGMAAINACYNTPGGWKHCMPMSLSTNTAPMVWSFMGNTSAWWGI